MKKTERLCGCGCGSIPTIAKETNRSKGWVKGQPGRYILGHQRRRDAAVRIAEKIATAEGDACSIWTGTRIHHGYGQFRLNGRAVTAHRAVWEMANGPIPPSLHVLHRCDNPPCVRLSHLFLGTAADNKSDMMAKGRGRNQWGTFPARAGIR